MLSNAFLNTHPSNIDRSVQPLFLLCNTEYGTVLICWHSVQCKCFGSFEFSNSTTTTHIHNCLSVPSKSEFAHLHGAARLHRQPCYARLLYTAYITRH